jgi:hypothetical protein
MVPKDQQTAVDNAASSPKYCTAPQIKGVKYRYGLLYATIFFPNLRQTLLPEKEPNIFENLIVEIH